MARNVRYEDIHVGDKASLSKTISEHDVYAFAGVTGDFNPVHVNAEFAKNSLFKQRIAHGMISAGLISAVLGTELPGIDTIYMNQELSFLAPVLYGDTLTATVECIEKMIRNIGLFSAPLSPTKMINWSQMVKQES